MCRQAPSCRAVLDQATALWPNRRTTSDGVCASSSHHSQNPGSDHEPNINGYASAVDLSDDKASGCDADAWADWLVEIRDPRVKYLIRNRQMVSSYPAHGFDAWMWRPYDGPNPHDSHTHLSVHPDALFDTSPWFPDLSKDDDDMPWTDADSDNLAAVKGLLESINHQIAAPAANGGRLARITAAIETLVRRAS